MKAPLITVLMPAYNAEKYIGEAIQSVLLQSFTEFELLIINDGSTDETEKIVRSFSDPRIVLINQDNKGISAALNNGLLHAKANYIARFDADDICLPERLEKQYNFLIRNPEYCIVGCDAEYIAENGDHLFDFHCTGHTHPEIMRQLYMNCPFIHSGVMYQKDAVLKAGAYSSAAHSFEDYLLWIHLVKYGQCCNLPEQLIKVRFNPQSITIDEKWRGRRFRQLKKKIVVRGYVIPEEAEELLSTIKRQDMQMIKAGSYYALCGKKFLINNHQPGKARKFLIKAIRSYPLRFESYALYMLSYSPKNIINWLHKNSRNKI